MNYDELKIRRIAAVAGRAYYQNFVYVECDPMEPTGLYENSTRNAAEAVARGESYSEEYGLLDDGKLITRAELDDGAATIDGAPIDVRGRCELRARFLTPHNFVIAAHQSAINNFDFDLDLEADLRAILVDGDRIDDLATHVRRLPKRPF